MWTFAWRNLLTRPLRTTLALIGLSIPILGVLGLFSLSGGLRNLVGDTLGQIQGVMVLRENVPTPVFSDLPAAMAGTLRKVPGVRAVAPEILKVAPTVEDRSLIGSAVKGALSKQRFQNLLDAIVIQGQDIPAHRHLKSAVFPSKMLPKEKGGGRWLDERFDHKAPHVVISKKIAHDFPAPAEGGTTRDRRVGDSIRIGGKPFEIIGIYDTGSMFLDVMILMDIDTARSLLNVPADTVSSFYVEATDPAGTDVAAAAIEKAVPGVDARSMSEFSANFARIMGQLDTFLLMTVSLALIVGVVGIINTMIMSTTERFAEFGVLRTNGWSQGNVLTLVTAESAYLGLLAGVLGCALALAGTAIANQFITGGLALRITSRDLAMGLALSVVMGTLGGLYPAWRAARLVPMDAIRLGSR